MAFKPPQELMISAFRAALEAGDGQVARLNAAISATAGDPAPAVIDLRRAAADFLAGTRDAAARGELDRAVDHYLDATREPRQAWQDRADLA